MNAAETIRQPGQWIAITHLPSPGLDRCELTHVARMPIDYPRALEQHAGYRRMLERRGARVIMLEMNRALPDSVFVEDTALVLDEIAVLASMGAVSRRAEPAGIANELRQYREVRAIELPATLDGGDVFRVGRVLFAGISARTNRGGVEALQAVVRPFDYEVRSVPVNGCLHLKSACTPLPDDSLLVNREWLDPSSLAGFDLVPIPREEPLSADVLSIDNAVCLAAGHNRTAKLIRSRGFEVEEIDLSEFAKAEGAVTCLSLLFRPAAAAFVPT